MLEKYLQLEENDIVVLHTGGDESFGRDTLQILRDARSFLRRYFALVEFPQIRGILVPDRKEYERLVLNLLGVEIEIPSRPGRLAQTQRTDLVFLSPCAYEEHSTYYYYPDEYRRLVFHELIHVLEEYLSPNIEVVPNWWSEGLAVYLSGQWKYFDQFRFRLAVLQGLCQNCIPRLEEIRKDIKLSYDWGWTVVMYLEKVFGREMIQRIIRECDDGNVLTTITEENPEDISQRWRRWIMSGGKKDLMSC